jgi:hypothetical protein
LFDPSEESPYGRLVRLRVREPLDADAVRDAGRGVHREAGEQLAQVALPLTNAAFGRRSGGHNEVGALEPDRVVAGAEGRALR